MKTLKILLLAATFTFALYSCQTDEVIPAKIPTPSPRIVLSIDGTYFLTARRNLEFYHPDKVQLKVHMEGEGEINEYGPSALTMDHLQNVYNIMDINFINEGSFTLQNESGTELYGQYSDARKNVNNNTIIHAIINGGTGDFVGASGSITIELEQRGNSAYLASVKGNVSILKNEDSPELI